MIPYEAGYHVPTFPEKQDLIARFGDQRPMKLAILCQTDSWYFADLQRAAGVQHELLACDFSLLHAEIGGSTRIGAEADLLNCDALLVRTMPPGSLEQVVFRMDILARLQAVGVLVINGPKAIEAAVDKYLTTARLDAAGLPVPRTAVCQDWREAMDAFDRLGGDCVVKPLFGGEGRGIARISDEAIAARTFRLLEQMRSVIYLQEFIAHEGFDIRVLLIGDRAWGMRRENAADWRTNISRGAIARSINLDDHQVTLARRAATAVDAEIAGVDLLPDGRGGYYVLEVNAVPGWKALAESSGVDIAAEVLRYVEERVDE